MAAHYLGIDPGMTGGLAMLDGAGVVLEVCAMPVAGKEVDFGAMADWIEALSGMKSIVAVIEKVGAMPGQGVTSMFNFGFSTGGLHGVLAAMKIPRYVVAPNTWRKLVLADLPKSPAADNPQLRKRMIKQASVDYCRRAYPDVSLLATSRSSVPHSGIADALCIARYAYIQYR